VIKVELLSH